MIGQREEFRQSGNLGAVRYRAEHDVAIIFRVQLPRAHHISGLLVIIRRTAVVIVGADTHSLRQLGIP